MPQISSTPTGAVAVLSGGAMRPLLAEAAPLFERTCGINLSIRFALTSVLSTEIEGGAEFDIAVLPRPELEALARLDLIAAGTQTDITRSTVGLCVRAGARKPAIGSVEEFKRALLEARTLGYSDGPSGAYVTGLLARLGIGEEMKKKVRLTSAPVAELVANGEAELGIQQIVAILPVAGAELVGPLPGELQNVIVYAAGVSAHAADARAAHAFISFMRQPDAVRIMRAKGLEPA